jgi:hypothetical protein
MLIAEASVVTERANRYLVQLCRHVHLVARAHPRLRARVEWSDDRGTISLGGGRCTLRAEPGVLRLRAEAPDEEGLCQLEQRVAERLEQVGRRDRLTVTWTPPRDAGNPDNHAGNPDNHAGNPDNHAGNPDNERNAP